MQSFQSLMFFLLLHFCGLNFSSLFRLTDIMYKCTHQKKQNKKRKKKFSVHCIISLRALLYLPAISALVVLFSLYDIFYLPLYILELCYLLSYLFESISHHSIYLIRMYYCFYLLPVPRHQFESSHSLY